MDFICHNYGYLSSKTKDQVHGVLKNFNTALFYGWGSTALRLDRTTLRRQFTFYHSLPRNSWYSIYRPLKDKSLSRLWTQQVVLNTGNLDWESNALTTRSLHHKLYKFWNKYLVNSLRKYALGKYYAQDKPTSILESVKK